MKWARKTVLVLGLTALATLPYTWKILYKGAINLYDSYANRKQHSIAYEDFKPGDEEKFFPSGCKSYGSLRRDVLVGVEKALGLAPLDVNDDGREDFLKLCFVRRPFINEHVDYVAGAVSSNSDNGYTGLSLQVRKGVTKGKAAEKGDLHLNSVRRQNKADELLVVSGNTNFRYLLNCHTNTCSLTPMTIDDYCSTLAIEDDGEAMNQACWGVMKRTAGKFKPKSLIPILRKNARLPDAARALGQYNDVLKPWNIADLCPDSTCITARGKGLTTRTSSELFGSMASLATDYEETRYVADCLERIITDEHRSRDACWNKNDALRTLASMKDPYSMQRAASLAFSPYLPECVQGTALKLQQKFMPHAFVK